MVKVFFGWEMGINKKNKNSVSELNKRKHTVGRWMIKTSSTVILGYFFGVINIFGKKIIFDFLIHITMILPILPEKTLAPI